VENVVKEWRLCMCGVCKKSLYFLLHFAVNINLLLNSFRTKGVVQWKSACPACVSPSI
jgi:hypothetical protein